VKKSVYVYLAVLAGVPCPLNNNLAVIRGQKVWDHWCIISYKVLYTAGTRM